jgi:hypothetical protein
MDGETKKNSENLDELPKYFNHKYYEEGIYFPKTSMFINECISLDSIETIAINHDDICFGAKTNNNLYQYKCDMDND